jgi:hypothetical protein
MNFGNGENTPPSLVHFIIHIKARWSLLQRHHDAGSKMKWAGGKKAEPEEGMPE